MNYNIIVIIKTETDPNDCHFSPRITGEFDCTFLWKNNILIDQEDVGGSKARTLFLYMKDGKTTVKSEGKEVEL